MQPAVCRSPGRRLKTSRIENVGICRIHGDIVNVPILIKHLLPALAAIFREKDASAVPVLSRRPSPCSEVKAIR
jgi:hypothetical protein